MHGNMSLKKKGQVHVAATAIISRWYPLNKGLDGNQSRPQRFGVEKYLLFLAGNKPRLFILPGFSLGNHCTQ